MDSVQSTEEFSPLPIHEDVSQSAEQTTTNQQGVESHFNANQDQSQTRRTKNHWELQLEFQDSNLSPALSLLPVNSGVAHFTECSLFQQSDAEFAPLRPCTDISAASEKFHFPPKNRESQASEYGSLSQYPLTQESAFSEEGVSSCQSLSPHSVSPEENSRQLAMASSPLSSAVDDRQGMQSSGGTGSIETDNKTVTASSHKQAGEVSEGVIVLVSRDSPAQDQKDLNVPSSSSAVSSASETSLKRTKCFKGKVESTMLGKPGADKITVTREHPAGEASLPQQQAQKLDLSQMPSCEVSNISMGSRSTQPDECSKSLRRELLLEAQKYSRSDAQPRSQPQGNPTTSEASLTPCPPSVSEVKPSRTRTNLREAVLTGLFSAGVEQGQREREVWSLRDQTGIDGSYINFLPQSQSTPGVFKPPHKSIVKPTSGQLSTVNSNMEDLSQSSAGRYPQSAVPVAEFRHNNTPNQCQEEAASAKVHSLPSLTYMQKVDAWQTNQRSGHLSLFDSLALQGFSGISPKKRAYDAVSGPLNDILNQRARSLHQHPVSEVNKNITQKSMSESGLFSPRKETVGSVTKDKGNDESAARPFASSVGRDESHSSLSTVLKSMQKAQQTQKSGERQNLVQDDVHQQTVATVQPLPFVSLGHFSDVTLSSSQDSSKSGKKLGASIGTSSVISMEVDNYIPNWNAKVTTPPALTRPRELNIEERIPLYLYNLDVEQSPSTILTPFVPRGPIRKPEFSPTDLSTIKGSVGTPTKSTQPSEGGSSQKEAFSRSSVLSVETNMSVSLSQDSICPALSIPKQSVSPSSSAAANQNDQRLAPRSQPDDTSPLPVLQSDSSSINSQDTTQVGNNSEGNLAKLPSATERYLDQSMHVSYSMQQKTKHSLVGTKELEDSHQILSQKETCGPAGISVSSPTASRLLSDDKVLLPRKKTDRQKDSSFISSSTDVEPTSPGSMVWTTPLSDSIRTSEKVTQPHTVHERKQSSVQSNAVIPGPSSLPVTAMHTKPQDSMISGSVGPMLTLSKSTWRTEPEGCSAVPPDNTIPAQLPLIKPSAVMSAPQATSSPAEAGVPEEIEQITQGVPAESSSSSPTLADTEQGTSDGSSELSQTAKVTTRVSPLSTRVAKLLQNVSSATTVSSMYIITDTEENTSKDWIKLKISRQQGDPLELDIEDRKRIDEIKRELMIKNTLKSQESTDTDSSVASTFRGLRKQESLRPTGTFNTVSGVDIQPSLQPLHLSMNLSDSRVQQYHPHYQDLASRVLEIAAREGIILSRPNPRTFTSISIGTSKRSPSPTKSAIPLVNPDPKLFCTSFDKEESVGTAPITVSELVNGNLNTIGDKYEGGSTLSPALDKEHVNVQEDNIQSQQENHKLMIQDISVSGVGHGVQQATGVSTTESPSTTGHISRVHLTLSPKAADLSVAADVQSSHATADPKLALSEFVKLRHSPSKASSPDKGLSIRPELSESRDPEQTTGTERTETSVPFKTTVPKGGIISPSPQSFRLPRRTAMSPRPFINKTPAVPILLPYKPGGSDELFYVPQTEADISSTDTTVESSHTGSDDAVPPRFSSEVLGHEDSRLDRGVTIRHTEGIYSKRAKTRGVKMQTAGHRGVFVAADCSLHSCVNRAPKPSSRMPSAPTTVPSSSYQEVSKRDQGTSPVQSLSYDQPQVRSQAFYPAHVEPDPVSQVRAERDKEKRVSDLSRPASNQRSSTLDQLRQRCCDQWNLEESVPTNDRPSSLLERVERLSLLIQRTRANNLSEEQEEGYQNPYTTEQRSRKKGKVPTVVREDRRGNAGEVKRGVRGEFTAVREEVPRLPEEGSSLTSPQRQQLCPPERGESDNLSTTSGSMSTVDTARLIRAFGAHRVQHLNTSSSLSKLYNAIHKQREETGGSMKRSKAPLHMTTPSDVAEDSSFAADKSSSSSSYASLPLHGPSRALVAKKAVKLVSKCIQAGDIEIVNNGTRRHTRDVGTTFPSPGETRPPRLLSSSSSSAARGRGGQKSSWKTQRKNEKPEAVSWFIPADDLRAEARKENQPEEEEEESTRRPYTWFEPYSRTDPWRGPLRQRQVHDLDPRRKPAASGLTRISLQEALEMRRPDFISQSRQRMRCLALQMEERKLQAVLNKQRHEHFHHLCPPGRLQRSAGAAWIRRAVPRKEMIQRSKRMYENLPEVQRRREEERRKMESCLNRLNAELYKKRVTERVLARRTAWR